MRITNENLNSYLKSEDFIKDNQKSIEAAAWIQRSDRRLMESSTPSHKQLMTPFSC